MTSLDGEDWQLREIAAPLDAIATDVFLLDLDGRNRYVMTKTENLAPLLDLPPTELSVERASNNEQVTLCYLRMSAP